MKKKNLSATLAPIWVPNVVLAIGAFSLNAQAQQNDSAQLESILVQHDASSAIKNVSSDKFTTPILDTPQSIQVVPEKVLKQQGAQSLQEVLRNVPGIAFALGEGGAGWGDLFTIRGMQAEQAVTIDDMPDTVLTTRSDAFNVEQIEVYKGTGSFESGAGALGGSVNLASKTAKLDDFNEVELSAGSSEYLRASVDTNHQLNGTSAFRINAMGHKNAVAGRGPVDTQRWGIAPTISFGLQTPTRLSLSYFQQNDRSIPDTGVPMDPFTGNLVQGADWNYFGQLANYDIETTRTKRATIKFEHDFSNQVRLTNQLRWAQNDRFTSYSTAGRLLNIPRGATINDDGLVTGATRWNTNDYYGYSANATDSLSYPSGNFGVARIQRYNNAYRGRLLSNQTNLNIKFDTGSIKHDVIVGLDLFKQSYRRLPYSYAVPTLNGTDRFVVDVRDPNQYYFGPTSIASSISSAGSEITNIGTYIYDNIKFNPQWEVSTGIRFDQYQTKWFDADGLTLPDQQKNNLVSGRVGINYKPLENGSIYLSYSRAGQPTAALSASRTGSGADSSKLSPAVADTWELGTKWELLNRKLLLTAAVFQTEKRNPTDVNPDDAASLVQYAATDRVRGLELTAAGDISNQWSMLGGLSLLDGKIVKDDKNPEQVGGLLKNVPKVSLNLWTNYQANENLNIGVGAQYVGKRQYTRGNQVSSGQWAGRSSKAQAPAYWLANASVGYKVNKNVSLRMNINNIFNKRYLAQASSSSDGYQVFGTPGAGRNVVLATNVKF